jgi:DNA-directed RNA polymerase specialized sigma24 family protein
VDTRSATPWTEAGQDPEWLRRAQRGDPTAALKIFSAHKLPLWRTCLVLTQQPREAARLFEETIEHATRSLPGAPVQRPLLPWLARLAREIDADRASSDTRDLSSPGERPDGKPWDESAPETNVERHALLGFSALDHDDQWLLALRVIEQLSYDDIAQVTGTTVEHVSERLAFARDQIDHEFDAEERAA